jgi:hypothetical protein
MLLLLWWRCGLPGNLWVRRELGDGWLLVLKRSCWILLEIRLRMMWMGRGRSWYGGVLSVRELRSGVLSTIEWSSITLRPDHLTWCCRQYDPVPPSHLQRISPCRILSCVGDGCDETLHRIVVIIPDELIMVRHLSVHYHHRWVVYG